MAVSKSTYQKIYALLDRVSPVPYDCGKLCTAACCGCAGLPEGKDEEELGMFLLPGEEQMLLDDADWLEWSEGTARDFFLPWSWGDTTVCFVRCRDPFHCHRRRRPIQCRTFPVLPNLDEDGNLSLVWNDMELPYLCPLIEEEASLSEEFLSATWEAWHILVQDPLIRDLVRMDSDNRAPDLNPEDLLYS